jgi:uncharacterized protein (TIGR03437 family)
MSTALRFICVAVLFVGCVWPQIATTTDGRSVYFLISGVRQRGSNQSFDAKLFVLRDNTLTLIEDSRDVRNPFSGTAQMFYEGIAASGDGSVFAINRGFICDEVGLLCRGLTSSRTTLVKTPTLTFESYGWADLTANGHFAALSFLQERFGCPCTIRLLDPATGTLGPEIVSPYWGDSVSHTVSEDGTVIGGNGGFNSLYLVGPSPSGPLHFAFAYPNILSRASLAGDTSTIVYEVAIDSYHSFIHVLDVKTGADRLIGPGTRATLAQDGRRFSYVRADNGSTYDGESNLQVWLGDAATGFTRRLSNVAEGISLRNQTITGDGSAVIATTNTYRLLSIDTMTGAVTQRLGPVGWIAFLCPLVRGSYNEALGPFPNGVPELLIGNTPVVSLGSTTRGMAFQVPWDVPLGQQITIRGSEPAWETRSNIIEPDFYPVVLPVGPVGPGPKSYAIHQDWSGVVNHESPAHPGEIIHFYGSGWGPVDGTIESGRPTPSDRLYRITNACDWRATGPDKSPQIFTTFDALFVGLAPGLVGVYQLDFRIPPDWNDSVFNAYCKWTSGDQRMFMTAPVEVQP